MSERETCDRYRIGFGGRVTLTLASWASVGLALLAYGADELIHVAVWATVSLALYGTRQYLDTANDHGGDR